MPSSVGVASASSIADPFRAAPKYSKRLLSDALDGRREGSCRIAVDPSGGIDTLARSTWPPPVSGSLDLAFLPAIDAPFADVSCCHAWVLSALTVRDSDDCSMSGLKPARRGD